MSATTPILLVVLPLLLGGLAYVLPADGARRWLVPVGGVAHFALVVSAIDTETVALGGWLRLDALGRLVLGETSLVFLIASLYAPSYLKLRSSAQTRVFCGAVLVYLGMVSLMIQSHHLGLMWVALDALTLAAAPLVYFDRNPRSLEATWKFLLVGSVGIALALLGSFFLAYAALSAGLDTGLLFEDLVLKAPELQPSWLHSAFILLFVGYGTKMGLAPMHTWKPDAYGEAPGVVGFLLAGTATSCAFLAILRFFQICVAAGQDGFAAHIMIVVGLLSVVVGAAFMVGQRDYKRMLAYSSVEHMGILVLGVGLGGMAMFGAMLHLLSNALTKGALFLAVGNIHRAYGTKVAAEIGGVLERLPFSGWALLAGFFAITGTPPFGVFVSELTILRSAISDGQIFVAVVFMIALLVVFTGMGHTVLTMLQGRGAAPRGEFRERVQNVAPIAACLGLSLWLGLDLPQPIAGLLQEATSALTAVRSPR